MTVVITMVMRPAAERLADVTGIRPPMIPVASNDPRGSIASPYLA